MASLEDRPIRPIDKRLKQFKRLKELNRRNREFWEAESKILEKTLTALPTKLAKELADKAAQNIECDALSYGLKSADGMEKEVDTLFEKLELDVKLTDHEKKIYKVIKRGGENLNGKMYCREVHRAKVRPRKTWLKAGCPSSYIEAYREGEPWTKRIEGEKRRIRKKVELAQLVELKKSAR
jgi:hypothetical protein